MNLFVDNCLEVLPLDKSFAERIAFIEKECLGNEAWTADGINQTLSLNGNYFGAFSGGELIGHVGVTCVLDEGYITNIAVLPSFRRQGVAIMLLQKLFCFAKDKKLSFIGLEVRSSNSAAKALYEKCGFEVVGIRKGFYSYPKEDAVIMNTTVFKSIK